jgi:hypothetical protein
LADVSPSTPTSRVRWTIAELSERVGAALEASGYQAPANGQVRAVPDLRTIRYYTSLGLLDRPLEMRGRTALYGPRHLYQLCAIKRLQAELAGLDDRALARVARISAGALAAADALANADEGAEVDEPPPRRAGAFWSAAPAAVARPRADSAARIPAMTAPRIVQAAKIQIAPGVQLEIAPVLGAFDPTLRSDDAAALHRAAAPLLEELRRQGLI